MDKVNSPWYDRVVVELGELNDKIDTLGEAFDKPGFEETVGEEQFNLLNVQYAIMVSYSSILATRIKAEDNWEPVEEKEPEPDPADRMPARSVDIIEINDETDIKAMFDELASRIIKDRDNGRRA